MTAAEEDSLRSRADSLVIAARTALSANDQASALAAAKQALSLRPELKSALDVLDTLRSGDGSSSASVVEGCRAFVGSWSKKDADALRARIRDGAAGLTGDQAGECLALLERRLPTGEARGWLDECYGLLVRSSLEVRKAVARRAGENLTMVHARLWEVGRHAVQGLLLVVLDSEAWRGKDEQGKAVGGLFQLSLARLINAGEDHLDWAMSDIVNILSAKGEVVKGLADVDASSITLECLDIRRATELRRAALTAVKLMLDVVDDGERYLRRFVTAKVKRGTNEDLIFAFSAAAATFPILPVPAAQLFLVDGFLQTLMPKLQQNTHESKERRSTKLQLSALDLLSAACQDGACRTHVAKYCTLWLQDVSEGSPDPECSALAALVLAKTYQVQEEGVSPVALRDANHLSEVLGNMLLNAKHDIELRSIVEGLSYVTMESTVKESLSRNSKVLHKLVEILNGHGEDKPLVLSILMIFMALVQHKPRQSEEQKKVSELKAYAEASKPQPEDPLLDNKHVAERCHQVLAAKAVPAIISSVKGGSDNLVSWMVRVLFNLSQYTKGRGQMAQQGAIKALLQVSNGSESKKSDEPISGVPLMASHALARILISVNPNHIFSGSFPVASAIRPLKHLLSLAESSDTGDLLPTFESLLALTNLASMDDPSAREAIVRTSFPQLENLLLYQNERLQQAATELVCNLMASPQTVALFADGSPAAKHRMHVLLALADAENMATRRAAGGAIAMLTEWDAATSAVLERDIGVKLVLGLCKEGENEECLHRGLVILANMTGAPGKVGEDAIRKVKSEGGAEVVMAALKRTRDENLMGVGVEVLKKLA